MWSTFFVTDEEGHTVAPVAPGAVVGAAPGAAAQGAGGLASLMSGRSTFGGNKRRRTTTAGHTMSEAQEGKVTGFLLCECVFSLRLYQSTPELMEPISHTAAFRLKSGPHGRQQAARADEGLLMLENVVF